MPGHLAMQRHAALCGQFTHACILALICEILICCILTYSSACVGICILKEKKSEIYACKMSGCVSHISCV